jgi:purine-binding chemotaxis protein CheW
VQTVDRDRDERSVDDDEIRPPRRRCALSGTFVQVRVADESYALPVEHVTEVSPLESTTPLPGAPSVLLGLRNVHGSVLPVYDLGALLDGATRGPPSRLVVVGDGSRRVGFAVDEVTAVGPLSAPDSSEAPLLLGSTLVGDRLVGVLDVSALLADTNRRLHT